MSRQGVDLLLRGTGAPWRCGQLLPDNSSKCFLLMRLDDAVMEAETLIVDIILFLRFGFIGLSATKKILPHSFDCYYHNSLGHNLPASFVFLLSACFRIIATVLDARPVDETCNSAANDGRIVTLL